MPRKNVTRVYAAWKDGKSLNLGSISTNGEAIYSYATCLVARLPEGEGVVLNASKYSVTTSQQQGGLRYLLAMDHIPTVSVDDLDRGVRPDTLREQLEVCHG